MKKALNNIMRIAMVMTILFTVIHNVYCGEYEIRLQELPFPAGGDDAGQSGSNPTHPNEFRAFIDSENNKITIYPNTNLKSDVNLQIMSVSTASIVYETYFSDSISIYIYNCGDYYLFINYEDMTFFGIFNIKYSPKTKSIMSDLFEIGVTEGMLKVTYKENYETQQQNLITRNKFDICMFNSKGDMILQTENKEIDISNLHSGIYMLYITTDSGQQTAKICIR